MYFYEYPHPAVTSDSVVFGFDGRRLHVLLIKRDQPPCADTWALPGGFLRMNETIEECAARVLCYETGLDNVYLQQFHTFSSIDRDPRERILSVAFLALVRKANYQLKSASDSMDVRWFDVDDLPELAFDHREILDMARSRLKQQLCTDPIAFRLLDYKFSMTELQRIYEVINERRYDRRNFARKMYSTGFLKDEGVSKVASHNRYPNLYSFDEATFLEEVGTNPERRFPFNF